MGVLLADEPEIMTAQECANCGRSVLVKTEADYERFQKTWDEYLLLNICPGCRGAELKPDVKRMIAACLKVREDFLNGKTNHHQ